MFRNAHESLLTEVTIYKSHFGTMFNQFFGTDLARLDSPGIQQKIFYLYDMIKLT